jgi:hypothetical protein
MPVEKERSDKFAHLSLNAMKVVKDYFELYAMMRQYFLDHQDYDIPDNIMEALDLKS